MHYMASTLMDWGKPMANRKKDMGIAEGARKVPCSEGTLRRLDRIGVIHPNRDPWGRRLLGDDDVAAARAYLELRRPQVA
jgi:hypothetical protein